MARFRSGRPIGAQSSTGSKPTTTLSALSDTPQRVTPKQDEFSGDQWFEFRGPREHLLLGWRDALFEQTASDHVVGCAVHSLNGDKAILP
jgi:hypothetical protein